MGQAYQLVTGSIHISQYAGLTFLLNTIIWNNVILNSHWPGRQYYKVGPNHMPVSYPNYQFETETRKNAWERETAT